MGYLQGFAITLKKTFAHNSPSGKIVTTEYGGGMGKHD
jgi:hypothetical protein